MFYFVHLLVGGLIGKYFPNIYFVIIASFIIHFILDILPHWDGFWDKKNYKKNYGKKIPKKTLIIEFTDIAITILLFIWLINFHNSLILIGGFFCILPDILKLFYLTPLKNYNFYKKYLAFHTKIQNDANFFAGISTQIIISLIAIFLFIHKL